MACWIDTTSIKGGEVWIENCLVTNNARGVSLGRQYASGDSSIRNCTIANNFNSSGGYGIYQDCPDVKVINTIVSGNATYGIYVNSGTSTRNNNLVFGHGADFHNAVKLDSEIVSDPKFRDAAGRNYQLRPNSGAINKGLDSAGIDDDLVGQSRPLFGNWDIGCYEYPYPLGIRAIIKWKEVK